MRGPEGHPRGVAFRVSRDGYRSVVRLVRRRRVAFALGVVRALSEIGGGRVKRPLQVGAGQIQRGLFGVRCICDAAHAGLNAVSGTQVNHRSQAVVHALKLRRDFHHAADTFDKARVLRFVQVRESGPLSLVGCADCRFRLSAFVGG